MRRRLLPAVVLVCACLVAPGGAAADAFTPPSRAFFGINVNRLFNDDLPADVVDRQLDVIERAGIEVARTDAMWAYVEPQGPPSLLFPDSWAETDRRMTALARHRIRWEPILDYTPKWQQTIAGDDKSAPKSNDAFATFAAAFAARYGPGGQFWSLHPELPSLPVTTYEIWNEPNGTFWTPRPDPAAYADLFVRAADAIHLNDAGATVMIGGLIDDGGAFLRSMFAVRPDVAGRAGAVAYHPYAPTTDGVIASIDGLETTLAQLGQATLPVHVNEVGWLTAGAAGHPLVMSDSARASNLAALVTRVATERVSAHIDGFLPYTFWTPERDSSDSEDWYGLWHADGSPTLAGQAYVDAISRVLAAPPMAVTGSARAGVPPQSTAIVTGSVNPAGCGATAIVQYATDTAYRTTGRYDQTAAPADVAPANGDMPVSIVLSGLQPGTPYHYRVVATNACSSQTAEGADGAFATAPPNDLTITSVRPDRRGRITVAGRSGWSGTSIARASFKRGHRLAGSAKQRKGAKKLGTVSYGRASVTTSRPGRFRLTIKPLSRLRAQLRSGKKLNVQIAVTFSPTGGTPNTKTVRVTVRQRSAR